MKAISYLAARPLYSFLLYCLIGIFIGIQLRIIVIQQASVDRKCKSDGNYQLFKLSYERLLGHQDLYAYDYEVHCFGYKYSPTFALAFFPFEYLPDLLGLILWISFSFLVMHVAVMTFPGMNATRKLGFLLLIIMEMVLTSQSQQTNALVVAFLLLGFMQLERGKYFWATLFIVATAFIKVFGIGLVVLYLFYPQKPKLVLYTLLWTVIFALIPLVVIGPTELLGVYESWYARTAGDYTLYVGMSMYAFLEAIIGSPVPKQLILGVSLLMMLATLLQFPKWQDLRFRQLSLAMLLMWMVAFNHKAESPSYIIGLVGVMVWFYSSDQKWWRISLLVFGLIGISLLYSDIIPKGFRNDYSYPFALKALPTTVIWLTALLELWFMAKPKKQLLLSETFTGIELNAPVARYSLKSKSSV